MTFDEALDVVANAATDLAFGSNGTTAHELRCALIVLLVQWSKGSPPPNRGSGLATLYLTWPELDAAAGAIEAQLERGLEADGLLNSLRTAFREAQSQIPAPTNTEER